MSINDVEPHTVYVIAGPNGAGKTTFSAEFLPEYLFEQIKRGAEV
jgi:predicted ABC-type ATPase